MTWPFTISMRSCSTTGSPRPVWVRSASKANAQRLSPVTDLASRIHRLTPSRSGSACTCPMAAAASAKGETGSSQRAGCGSEGSPLTSGWTSGLTGGWTRPLARTVCGQARRASSSAWSASGLDGSGNNKSSATTLGRLLQMRVKAAATRVRSSGRFPNRARVSSSMATMAMRSTPAFCSPRRRNNRSAAYWFICVP